MSDTDIRYSKDGNWKVEFKAFKTNLFVYKEIGTKITVYHKDLARGFLGLGSKKPRWVERPATSLSIYNTFEGTLPNLSPSAAQRSASRENADSCECKLWSAGIGVSMDASASPGLPDVGTAKPSPKALLDVRSVRGRGTVFIGQEMIVLQEVYAD